MENKEKTFYNMLDEIIKEHRCNDKKYSLEPEKFYGYIKDYYEKEDKETEIEIDWHVPVGVKYSEIKEYILKITIPKMDK